MRFPVPSLALFACLLASGPGLSAHDLATLLTEGHAQLAAAATGAPGAAQRAHALFEQALAQTPADASARAGRGLATLALALEAPLPQKLPLAQAGCADLDAAVLAAPEDAAIRLHRARAATLLPRSLRRHTIAEQDFQILLTMARAAPPSLTPAMRREILYHAAAFALAARHSEAIALLEEAAAIPAASPSDEQVQSMLALAHRQLTSPSHAHSEPLPPTPAP